MDYGDCSLEEFLDNVASETVAPAGGTAMAVVGAIGASLCEMVCVHTIENAGDETVKAEMTVLRDDLHRQREHLLNLAEADATVVDDLFAKGAGEVGEVELKRSIGIPLTVAVACRTVLELTVDVVETGSTNALPDAGTGAMLTRTALQSAVYTARSNVHRVVDQSFVDDVEERASELETRADKAHELVLHTVDTRS